ncbi:MAG: energy-coupling factor transporter ATPase [Acetivibrionales bacterium]|nr:energy-coupling factor transporter ATPase [Clostridiales bacterium]HPZ04491.1 energy-coupling factor transporter ATPase [Clostridiales bacterium]HQD31583.1 energy-coupling factor transporter ATPase [Clostridiales bacterium]
MSVSKGIIDVKNASYVYRSHSDDAQDVLALDDVSLSVMEGEFLAVLGRNGSGKSTLAKLMNALILPQSGTVIVNSIDTSNEEMLWDIRSCTGMVFQNPDNQIVGTVVEEDVAFGPENLGVPPKEIRVRVDESLEMIGMTEFKKHAPHQLSGGQKQRVAIAGILAMRPKCIVLDEATAMLDPSGRKEVMRILRKLNTEEGITIVHITHHMDEAGKADRVLVIDEGKCVMLGTPREVFSDVKRIKSLGLDVPQVTELMYELNKSGFDFPTDILTVDEAVKRLRDHLGDD